MCKGFDYSLSFCDLNYFVIVTEPEELSHTLVLHRHTEEKVFLATKWFIPLGHPAPSLLSLSSMHRVVWSLLILV